MTHEIITKEKLSKHFNVKENDIQIIDRLKGGMSNSNYIVKIKEEFFTFRIPGKNAFAFVDRHIEQSTLELIKDLHIDGNLLIDLELETGYKISRFVEGTPLMVLNPADYYDRAANILKKLHQSSLKATNDYAPFERLKKYEALVETEGIKHQTNYYDILNRFLEFKPYLEALPKVLCHNDSQPSNFILRPDETLLLVDWEFGGNNDFFYDIACFGNNDFKFALGLLPVYLNRTPEKDEWLRLYLWRTFQCLQWHNVALYKEAIGLSQELHLDFKAIAEAYIVKANALFTQALSYR
ncbi:MAG: phosphotransferase [Tenericutes bacterium HGW-Tenericutes-1]|jgi:thiamine kinase-like enzyme|nr:MAG: phosphotransferase [Tenericutes bacterium HGW-Tenericutes-1]